jgi:lipoate-protein ligase A
MAFDAELFKHFEKDQAPILRFFYFKKPTLTLGRLEARRLQLDKLSFPYEIRPTGGRAVLHGGDDLCYAILAPKSDPLVGGDLIASYCRISKLLAKSIQTLGRKVEMTTEKHLGAGDPHCFSAPSQAELTMNGKKVAGGAQARHGEVFLQQGVVLLSVAQEWKSIFPSSSVENMTGLNDVEGMAAITRGQLEEALRKGLEQAGIQFEKP